MTSASLERSFPCRAVLRIPAQKLDYFWIEVLELPRLAGGRSYRAALPLPAEDGRNYSHQDRNTGSLRSAVNRTSIQLAGARPSD